MADAVAWTSLAISVAVAVFTIWHEVMSYRRTHRPHITVLVRQVSFFQPETEGDEPGGVSLGTGFQVRVVNTGARPVEISQVHTQIHGHGVRWLSHAQGWVGIHLNPGASKEWVEDLEPHFGRVRRHEPSRSLNFLIRGVATTSDNRTFWSPYVRVQHPSGPLSIGRLRLENWWRRVRAPLRRKPDVLN